MAKTVQFSLKHVKARDVSDFQKALHEAPHTSLDLFAGLLAKTVVSAPEEIMAYGALNDPETYLEVPYWGDEDPDLIIFMDLVNGLNEALEKAQSVTKSK